MIKNMNSEMKTNVQLSTTESKKQKQTKQITRIGITEMENTWRGISGQSGRIGEKVQGIRSRNGRYKIGGG